MKIFNKSVALILTVVLSCALCLVGCSSQTAEEDVAYQLATEKIDNSKTQLFVYNFNGGFGSSWLASAKKKFEALHAEDVYESGKKGVQIIVNPQKSSIMSISSQILGNRDEIYFTEYAYYYSLKNAGVLLDLTDAMTETLPGESKNIIAKLSSEQKSYYGVEENGQIHYYGIPHYAGYCGINYNIDLFEENDFYFADVPDEEDTTIDRYFINKHNKKKSAGPDGIYDTYDDGLPVTYSDFFVLCDYIAQNGATPLSWTGQYYSDYLNFILCALTTDADGLDQVMLNYTFNGEATNLGTIKNGQFVLDSTPTTITPSNGYEISRQEGKYYALSFLKKIMETSKYQSSGCFSGSCSHVDAQSDFVYSGTDGSKPIAMLLDGSWWMSEAENVFNTMSGGDNGHKYSAYNRNFGYMPLPKPTEAIAQKYRDSGKSVTLYDQLYSLCFIKSNIADWKKPLAKEFLRFVNTDVMLKEFTSITSTVKALNYSFSESELQGLTPFCRSLLSIKDKADICYPYSTTPLYMNNQSAFTMYATFKTNFGGRDYSSSSAPTLFYTTDVSVDEYFSGMYTYYKKDNIFKQ